ncbi:MAG: HD domain-containing protein [Acidimicrobiia bacterium]|jgi:predicted HD phosphohydrolase|nr:HD domain-containing protein [Actinomycetota bacterium]NDB05835.1 HD domain-containing protein [Acidimicrobiia bacterium]NDA76434.1 HD domain-containing protein [Actinomycetota bacterium]NDD95876.1 HD domain-containing protein [Actinomycetota bacterium]NDE57986.1 HD domain-containing protein [Acidimicrobiia bacterium]
MKIFTDTTELVEHLRVLATTESVEAPGFLEIEHGLQCAALLKASHPDDLELQVAGLIHDLAHPWDGPGQPRHATMGADAVRGLLGERVASLIEGHVPAKRYLVSTRSDYRALLSADSIMTLDAQGGELSADEIRDFEAQPHWRAMVDLRIADDGAKDPNARVPGLDHWVDTIHALGRKS